MRTFRIVGAIFCVFGCFFALLGILTSVLPMIENEQFQMILNSFQETSADPLTNTLNTIVLFCLHSGYFLLFCGISITVAGGLISASAHRRQKAGAIAGTESAFPVKQAAAPGIPKPAYYPGGAAPPAISPVVDEEAPAPKIVSTFIRHKSPISGGVEPALQSDDSDAHRLMLNDEQLAAEALMARPSSPDYSQYLSNAEPARADALAAEQAQPKQAPPRPKIVSTIGKNKP